MIRPARGVVLVRKAETEETMPGGKIIIPQDSREKIASYQVEIVAVGAPERCENKYCGRDHSYPGFAPLLVSKASRHEVPSRPGDIVGVDAVTEWVGERLHILPENVRPGAWALVRPRSFVDASHPTESLYYVRQVDVLGVFRTT